MAGLKETHTQERVKTTGLTKAMRKQADNALIVFIRLKSPVLFGVTGSIRLRDENGFYIPLTWGGGHVHSPPEKVWDKLEGSRVRRNIGSSLMNTLIKINCDSGKSEQ